MLNYLAPLAILPLGFWAVLVAAFFAAWLCRGGALFGWQDFGRLPVHTRDLAIGPAASTWALLDFRLGNL